LDSDVIVVTAPLKIRPTVIMSIPDSVLISLTDFLAYLLNTRFTKIFLARSLPNCQNDTKAFTAVQKANNAEFTKFLQIFIHTSYVFMFLESLV